MSEIWIIRTCSPYCVVHHEYGVYQSVRNAYAGLCVLINGAPLGGHLGPRTQSGGAFDGQDPTISLQGLHKRAKPQRLGEIDAPSHQSVNRCMRPRFNRAL